MKGFAGLLLAAASLVSATPGIQGIMQSISNEDMLLDLHSGLHKRQNPPGEMPVIDLGYVKQRATEFGTAGGVSYYIFRNIRFAAPPVGELRFKKPQSPAKETVIQDGNFNSSTACAQPAALGGAGNSGGTEDCLFVDVWMPVGASTKQPLPVLASWYGGGYAYGSKESAGSPVGLWKAGAPPFIYVAPNYRLGVFGWLAAPDVDITPNAGLHDTIFAMDWIREHIPKFGGDLKQSTAMGLSAGAGVVMHAMVSNHKPYIPFQQVILQSPGWQPETTPAGRAPIYQALLKNSGCKDTACLRALPTGRLQDANFITLLTWNSDGLGPTSGFYPVPDGDILLDHPANLFTEGKVHPTVKRAVASSARWEAGGSFAIPEGTTDPLFVADVKVSLTSNQTLINIIEEIYPPDNTDKSGYNRGRDLTGDFGFNCNSLWVLRYFSQLQAAKKHTSKCTPKPGPKSKAAWRFEFNIGTAAHGADFAYTWYGARPNQTIARPDLVKDQQKWVIDFVTTKKVDWPVWQEGPQAKALWLNDTGAGVAEDYFAWERNVKRCDALRTRVIGKGGAIN